MPQRCCSQDLVGSPLLRRACNLCKGQWAGSGHLHTQETRTHFPGPPTTSMHGSLVRIKLPFLEITKHALCQKNCHPNCVPLAGPSPGKSLSLRVTEHRHLRTKARGHSKLPRTPGRTAGSSLTLGEWGHARGTVPASLRRRPGLTSWLCHPPAV